MNPLFSKYDVPAPRYTSYPTVPYWDGVLDSTAWIENLKSEMSRSEASWSLYLHIPFCESLCTFCGCNTVITKNHSHEEPYLKNLLQEWSFYLEKVPRLAQAPLQHLHLGGGTPTFLSPQNLDRLLRVFLDQTKKSEEFEGSIEVDPRRTSKEHLMVLRELGFQRISLGVQDFNPEVQRLINRVQSFEQTEEITRSARHMGFTSVNFDLIYGLAQQTPELMLETVRKTLDLRPDRIALYSLALVPWIKPAQRLFKDEDLPVGQEKRALYELAREQFLNAGYVEVGMDHFALPDEALAKALANQSLHRNFMGYTDRKTDVLLGLGVSAISESPQMFHQNEKLLPTYSKKIEEGEFATFRGHSLTTEDQERRRQILDFMTKGQVPLESDQLQRAQAFLLEMKNDGLVDFVDSNLVLTDKGRPFLRNACIFFDERLKRRQPDTKTFSQAL